MYEPTPKQKERQAKDDVKTWERSIELELLEESKSWREVKQMALIRVRPYIPLGIKVNKSRHPKSDTIFGPSFSESVSSFMVFHAIQTHKSNSEHYTLSPLMEEGV